MYAHDNNGNAARLHKLSWPVYKSAKNQNEALHAKTQRIQIEIITKTKVMHYKST